MSPERRAMSPEERRTLGRFLLIMGLGAAAFPVGILLHNVISAVLGVEEPVFFLIALVVAPLAFFGGGIASLVILVRGMRTEMQRRAEK